MLCSEDALRRVLSKLRCPLYWALCHHTLRPYCAAEPYRSQDVTQGFNTESDDIEQQPYALAAIFSPSLSLDKWGWTGRGA